MKFLSSPKTALKLGLLHGIHHLDRWRHGNRRVDLIAMAERDWGLTTDPRGHLLVQGCDLVELGRRHGTPLYVVNREQLERTYHAFRDSFASRYPQVEVAYSYKTNPVPGVIRELHAMGAIAEVISEFELWLALHLGVPPERIIVNGPGKTPAGLERAVTSGVRIINIDSPAEIDAIDALAARHGVLQKVGVRVITSVGWSSQFGIRIDSGEALEAFRRIRARANLAGCGIHLHLGTGIQDVGTYVQAIREVLEFAGVVHRETGLVMEYLDFGGGFGVPTVRHHSVMDGKLMLNGLPPLLAPGPVPPAPTDYAEAITTLVRRFHPDGTARLPTLVFEPGRAISSSAQLLLLEVLAIKDGRDGVRNVILNGGKNITMPLGYEFHRIFAASRMREPVSAAWHLFGPLCHPGDIVAQFEPLPELAVGDVLAIMDAGAYFVPNQMNFSNPRPGVVMVSNGRDQLIREHESFEDIVRRDRL